MSLDHSGIHISRGATRTFSKRPLTGDRYSGHVAYTVMKSLLLCSTFYRCLFRLFTRHPVISFPRGRPIFQRVLMPFSCLRKGVRRLRLRQSVYLIPFQRCPFLAIRLRCFVDYRFFRVRRERNNRTNRGRRVPRRYRNKIIGLIHRSSFSFILYRVLPFLGVQTSVRLHGQVSQCRSIVIHARGRTFRPRTIRPSNNIFRSPFDHGVDHGLLSRIKYGFRRKRIYPFMR